MSVILFLESIGGGELMVVLLFVLMFFGSSKIPDLAKGLGRGMREFKDAMSGVQNEIRQNISEIENTAKEETPVAVKPALSQPLHQEEAPTIEPVTENPAPKTHE